MPEGYNYNRILVYVTLHTITFVIVSSTSHTAISAEIQLKNRLMRIFIATMARPLIRAHRCFLLYVIFILALPMFVGRKCWMQFFEY